MASLSTIDQIDVCIKWLNDNDKSNNLVEICKVIDKLAVLSVSIGHQVSEAYALMNEMEDDYKWNYADSISQSSKSVAKAESDAEVAMVEYKSRYTQAKNGYKRLSIYLDRIDKVMESYRQLVSVAKMDLKLG